MAMDAQPVPVAEQKVFVRQNIFPGIYKPPVNDAIDVNVYQDFSFSMVGSDGYFAMATGVNVVLNHVFEFGPFCNYFLQDVTRNDTSNPGNTLFLDSYFYCGNMFAYTPLSEKKFHPKIYFDIGLGNAHGYSRSASSPIQTEVDYVFLVLKPAIALEINLWSFLQWTAAIQYRFQAQLNGPSDDLGGKASGLEISTGPVFQF